MLGVVALVVLLLLVALCVCAALFGERVELAAEQSKRDLERVKRRQAGATQAAKSITLSARRTRIVRDEQGNALFDGHGRVRREVVDHGKVAYWHRNPLRRMASRLRGIAPLTIGKVNSES